MGEGWGCHERSFMHSELPVSPRVHLKHEVPKLPWGQQGMHMVVPVSGW